MRGFDFPSSTSSIFAGPSAVDVAALAPDTTWEEEGCSSTVKTSTAFL